MFQHFRCKFGNRTDNKFEREETQQRFTVFHFTRHTIVKKE